MLLVILIELRDKLGKFSECKETTIQRPTRPVIPLINASSK